MLFLTVQVLSAVAEKPDGRFAKSANGKEVKSEAKDRKVNLKGKAAVIKAIITSNGVILVIDTGILSPKE